MSEMSLLSPLNLRKLFGHQFKILHEPSYRAERTEFRKEEEPWLQIIPCQHGHIYPHGGNRLAWAAGNRGPICSEVCRLPFVTITQDGGDGVNVAFDVAHFDQVAELVQPKRKPPKRVMTDKQREALAKYQYRTAINEPQNEPGRIQTPQDGLGAKEVS